MIKQPVDSHLCGQVCVAVLAGITLDRAVEVVGHGKGTKTKELARALRMLGYECPERLKVLGKKKIERLPRALVKISFPNLRRWHWVVVIDGKVHDPCPWEDTLRVGRATSYLPITEE